MQDDNNDIKIEDAEIDGEQVKIVKVKSPYAVPAVRGIMTPIILGIIVAGIAAPFIVPAEAALIAIANGIASLGWFWLYKVSSSAAASYFNQLTLQRALFAAEADMMRQYVTGIVKKVQGNLSEENLSNSSDEGKLEGEPEQE